MADEYIRREDALKGKKTGTFANGICFVAEPCVTVEYIESLEPADVVQVVHGKWIPHREKSREYTGTGLVYVMYDYWFCDTCGYRVENGQPMYNFCPNCGAKMDGERKE